MFYNILKNEFLSIRRSSFWTTSIVQSVILALFGLYLIANFLILGIFAGTLLKEQFPEDDIIQLFSGIAVYYFLADLIVRFIMQKFPSLDLKQYLILNIPKSSLTHFVLLKSLFSFFNYLPLFVFIPFYFTTVKQSLGFPVGLQWLMLMILLIVLNNYISYLIDRLFGKKPAISLSLLGLVALLIYSDFKGILSLFEYFQVGMQYLYSNGWPILIPAAIFGFCYYGLFQFLKSNAYLDNEDSASGKTVNTYDFPLFKSFGDIGKWMQLEAKMIWRNKRSKTFLILSVLFIFYPFAFMQDSASFNSRSLMILMGLIMTGAFSLNYGQLLLSWNSDHFDLILTQNLSLNKFLKAKYYLLALSNVALFLMTLPYAFFTTKFLLINFAMFLFNTGFTIWVYFFLSLYFSKKIDPAKGGMFNYEGFGAAHYLIMIPIMAVPILVYLLFRYFGLGDLGIVMIGVLGLIGIVLRSYILNMLQNKFIERKYKLQNTFSKA